MLNWISDEDLKTICKEIISDTRSKISDEVNFKNIVDPFSALFDIAINNISFEDWFKNENIRQRQKTLQNKIGRFHQFILGKVKGWEDLETGNVIDLVNKDQKIIAEIKNKHNTVKGDNKIDVFNELAYALNFGYKGYKAYYVTILSKKRIDKPFAPSDSKKGGKPAGNPNIREIDGASFYEMATGSKTALCDLYEYLPKILVGFTDIKVEEITLNHWFKDLASKLPWD